MRQRELPAVLAALSGACLWGIIWYPLNALEARGVSGLWTTFLSFTIIGVVFLGPVLISWRRGNCPLSPLPLALLLVFGGLTNLLFFLALTETSVVRALMFFYLSPVWNLMLGRLTQGQPLTLRKLVVVGVGLAGATILLGAYDLALFTWNRGDTFALLSGLCFAISIIGLQMSPMTPAWALTSLHWLGTAFMAFLGLLILRPDPPSLATWPTWLPLLLLFAFANQATASLCILFALTRLESYRVNVLMLFEIIVGTVSYALWSANLIHPHEWLGIGLIMTASLLDSLSGTRPRTMETG
ncbi:MAG: hypothetical protein AUK28_02925 [Desulfobacterales bacterium CG2_30_60_27]|nr:MAG: hypothetical protein AUK28_02925 [Desulfobacterales bacterium CG2_30_60_27]